MRRLGTELGSPDGLFKHVGGREESLDEMVDVVSGDEAWKGGDVTPRGFGWQRPQTPSVGG